MKRATLLSVVVVSMGLMVFLAKIRGAESMSRNFEVELPSIANSLDVETIAIPNGRPIYALLVSGFYQNRNFDMFHWYNFAKCLQEKGAYVHYAWWNNLLAPYMEKPLHNPNSVPGWYVTPFHDLNGYLYGWSYPNKALPAEDYQFQADATEFLIAIRDHNPDAIIILVGHSMGGDAVVRLADSMPDNFIIDLLAPMDPVGNRTEIPLTTGGRWCCGYHNFTRFNVTLEDRYNRPPPFFPVDRDDWILGETRRKLGANIKYLYHRWQHEYLPPFDGVTYIPYGVPILPVGPYQTELLEFDPPRPPATSICADSSNIQALVPTSLSSGFDAYPRTSTPNWGGGLDGHGEIVGFRDVWAGEGIPMALKTKTPDEWPSRDKETNPNNANDPKRVRRVQILKAWENDPDYLRKNKFEPKAPDLCMVSDDMCTILDTMLGLQINSAPVAEAGAARVVDCGGPYGTEVMLDGAGSSDPDDDALIYEWTWNGEMASGVNPTVVLPTGLTTVTLTVSDGVLADSDTVDITIADRTRPDIACPVNVSIECPADPDTSVTGSATATDSCDTAPVVTHIDSIDPGPGNTGVVKRTWTAEDTSGNTSSCEQVVVIEDTTAPELSVSVEPAFLRPSNHKMARITALIQVSDTCDDGPTVQLMSILCSEPDNDIGDGNTRADVQGADFGTDDRAFSLRAERTGKGPGRIYTVEYRAIDASGNPAVATAEVVGLHDRGR